MAFTDLHIESYADREATSPSDLHLVTEAFKHVPLISFTITGKTYLGVGTTLQGGVTCRLHKDNGDGTSTWLQETVSDGSGIYTFTGVTDDDPNYYITGWLDGVKNKYDVTDHDINSISANADIHLMTLLDREDVTPANLHLVTEAFKHTPEVFFNGFDTDTTGAYNPIFSGFKSKRLTAPWRNTKGKNYIKEKFEFGYGHHLTVISNKERNKKFRLAINCAQIPIQYVSNLQICQDVSALGFTSLSVIKSCFDKIKIQKLKIYSKIDGINAIPITIKTSVGMKLCTPISVKLWIKRNLTSKLGVNLWLGDKIQTRVTDSTYILEDVGNISDIEMIEIIGDINELAR